MAKTNGKFLFNILCVYVLYQVCWVILFFELIGHITYRISSMRLCNYVLSDEQ